MYRVSAEGLGNLLPDEPYPLRPLLDVRVNSLRASVSSEFLVDSGCPYNLMSLGFARRLQLDLPEESSPLALGGQTVAVKRARVTLILPWCDAIEVDMGFAGNWQFVFGGILGQRGFFDLADIAFDRRRGRFKIDGLPGGENLEPSG